MPVAHADLASGLDMASYKSEVFECISIQSVLPAAGSSDRLAGESSLSTRDDGCEMSPDLSARDTPFVCAGSRDQDAAMYAFVYPNLMVNIYGPWIDTNVVVRQPLSYWQCL